MQALRLFALLVVGFLVVMDSGSGAASANPKPIAALGVLTWEDGKPVAEATVVFLPDDPSGKKAAGFTGKDGSFALTTFNQDDGAVPGDYKVIVSKGSTIPTPQEKDPTKLMQEYYEKSKVKPKKTAVPEIYSNPKTSPLKWRVEAGGGTIKLKLKNL